jgi:hypothetical protein
VSLLYGLPPEVCNEVQKDRSKILCLLKVSDHMEIPRQAEQEKKKKILLLDMLVLESKPRA